MQLQPAYRSDAHNRSVLVTLVTEDKRTSIPYAIISYSRFSSCCRNASRNLFFLFLSFLHGFTGQ